MQKSHMLLSTSRNDPPSAEVGIVPKSYEMSPTCPHKKEKKKTRQNVGLLIPIVPLWPPLSTQSHLSQSCRQGHGNKIQDCQVLKINICSQGSGRERDSTVGRVHALHEATLGSLLWASIPGEQPRVIPEHKTRKNKSYVVCPGLKHGRPP